jgi:hypothetical protein
MDCSIHTSTSQQISICRINDDIDLQLGDISLNYFHPLRNITGHVHH